MAKNAAVLRALVVLLLGLPAAIGCASTAAPAGAQRGTIAAWAENTPQGLAEMGVTQVRTGCGAPPETCVQRVAALERSEGIGKVAITLALPRPDPGQVLDYAARYAQLSARTPGLVEIGIDDYYHFMRRNTPPDFTAVVETARSAGPPLLFGVTLYEDELDSVAQSPALFPPELLARIDRVYLYLHYRANGPDYARYVTRARALFPNAQIFGGVYAYDRIDYIACAEGPDKTPCTRDQEIGLFREALTGQIALMRSGTLDGLEFYPGQFGREERWNGWNEERICRPDRRAECIENTQEMRRIARSLLAGR